MSYLFFSYFVKERKLTLKMVKSLYKGLKIPAEILLA